MSTAQNFVSELNQIQRDEQNFADRRLLALWVARVRLTAPTWSRIDTKSEDATEAYQFDDGSIIVIGNPRQVYFPVLAYETPMFNDKLNHLENPNFVAM